MIFRIGSMIAGKTCQAGLPDGRWVRAVPRPFYDGLLSRIGNAWKVIRGDAYAIYWPKAGELEAALDKDV